MVSKIDFEPTGEEIYAAAIALGLCPEDMDMFPDAYIDILHTIEQDLTRMKREAYERTYRNAEELTRMNREAYEQTYRNAEELTRMNREAYEQTYRNAEELTRMNREAYEQTYQEA